METDEQKKERQQRALGAAFLAHQVSELEKSVDTLAFSRDPRLYGRGGGRGRGRGGRGGGSNESRQDKREVRVVDASALVHALPVLKRWIREDRYQLVVPLSALSTLDLLKKASNPLHDLARDATRFLEGQLDIARQIQAAFSPVDADARTRLRAQRQTEEMPWSEVEKLFRIPEGWVVELPEGVEVPPPAEGGEEPEPLPLPTANDIPRQLRSTIQCILHFHSSALTTSPSDSSPVGVVYNSLLDTPPPLAEPVSCLVAHYTASPTDTSGAHSSPRRKAREPATPPDFLALSSGDALSYYLSTFFPSITNPIYAIPSTEVVAASSWLKAQAQAKQQADDTSTHGRGGGRGGRGRGRGEGGEGRGGRGRGGRGGRGRGGSAQESGPRTLFVP
ncbi:hypothetical protein JCM10296v2_000645 [Rhodotorula toruloides]